jgi:hypothetical protein
MTDQDRPYEWYDRPGSDLMYTVRVDIADHRELLSSLF